MSRLSLKTIENWIEENDSRLYEEFKTFLRFPSVSSEPAHRQDLLRCADWLVAYLKKLDFEVEVWPTTGHPVIFASDLRAGPGKPVLLIYNHYDVQPADPEEEWLTPPFEPTLRDGEIYARGAQDNKGQCFYVLQALKFLRDNAGAYPINIKLCIEGEEETGSAGLDKILEEKKPRLKADYLAVVDTGIRRSDTPAITLGMRGIVTLDVVLHAALRDLHSGMHGGTAINSIHALVELLASLRDENGRVIIPGFYDRVVEMTDREKSRIATSFDANEYRNSVGEPLGGENNIPPVERAWLRPTLEINGISGGYTGEGFKTVIPAKARAKISCRLVPDQDPVETGNLVADYLKKNAPEGTRVEAVVHTGHGKPIRSDIDAPIVRCFSEAFSNVFKVPCEYIFSGGSIPVITELAAAAESQTVLIGLGLDSDCIHAPNEHFGFDRIKKGIMVMAQAIEMLGAPR